MIGDFCKFVPIKTSVVAQTFQRDCDGFRSRLACSACKWRDGCVDDISTGFNSFQVCHFSNTACRMCVDFQRQINGCFDFADQFIGDGWRQHAGHVLDADGICAHFSHFLRQADEIVDCVEFAGCIGDCSLAMAASLFGDIDGCLQVAQVIQRIEDTHNIDPVFDRFFDECADDIIGIVFVSQ